MDIQIVVGIVMDEVVVSQVGVVELNKVGVDKIVVSICCFGKQFYFLGCIIVDDKCCFGCGFVVGCFLCWQL